MHISQLNHLFNGNSYIMKEEPCDKSQGSSKYSFIRFYTDTFAFGPALTISAGILGYLAAKLSANI